MLNNNWLYKYIQPGLKRRLIYSEYIREKHKHERYKREQYKKCITYKKDETDIVCSICYDEIKNVKVKTLPCLHIFHYLCINKWSLIKKECPMCRAKL
jgi:hypothetical protein